ncbi:lipid IV(A) 3-deoxy-D-manno-octulosonic acid transferase [Methylomarinum sp. Ch1-1]|uniref:3-deoxy-D-manno-octulosonic acid transferase n=1 Tax=Methylomarinum roseum TaxID=3067653 RepID=A0AAU7NTN6_9GAMM|nr:lipid IV(A) 3-deoxy-D-manno-octulosonic acid transferase [Methylomarinum sp. Ch1-1]MDP4519633.1 lipid IV(A) 3-deoxy-D-manno-octulosonic acid transferase [Methylomarinum sp. Ch1-1]
MRFIYTALFHLLLPFVLVRLYWRGMKAPEYRKRWLERLAVYNKPYPQQVIWFHAVSVGEAEAVFPLVRLMQQRHRQAHFLVTTTTPTGSSRVKAVLGDRVEHVYLPYDLPSVVRRFLDTFQPKLAVIMEKEIWPNLFAQCGENNIPLFIINARLSANSAKGYRKIPSLVIPALGNVTSIATQTEEDRRRFVEIGAPEDRTLALGNIKFDVVVDEKLVGEGRELKRRLFAGRFVWIIASTHKGEDEIFMMLYRQLKVDIPELLLLIVPRHPERFQEVKRLAEERELNTVMRSVNDACSSDTDVYIADTMGELKMLYAAADIAFVGGSMVPVGGHNILEPLAVGLPVMFGPHMINFKEIADKVLAMQAALQCLDEQHIIGTAKRLHADAAFRERLTEKGGEFLRRNQGATGRVCSILEQSL